ncbi:putative inactive receptor kinase [Ananas comosus]|uniref:Putative inactive receptor kinase n=1 Tax=Ananas comosus TaxID=4615 RepID=A0A199VSW0_ANACO|nr:putative inactive receptor kinase [Ananas comosus]
MFRPHCAPVVDPTALRADPRGGLLGFSPADPTPCRWRGVGCSAEGKVIRLVLESLSLNGTFPPSSLSRLDQLRVLSLKRNSLSGPIPNLSTLTNLKALFLDHNLFSGPFPSSLLSLRRLRTLDLSSNRLSGRLPPALAALDRLAFLRLDANRFAGPVPPLNQSSLRVFNVSSNNLSGPVPVTAPLSAFGASAFAANPGLCGVVVRRECGSHFAFFCCGGGRNASAVAPSPIAASFAPRGKSEGLLLPGSTSPSRKLHKSAVVVIGFVAGAFLVIGFVGVSVAVNKKKRRTMMMTQGNILTPDKSAPTSGEMYVGDVERAGNELAVAAAAAMVSEEKVKRLGKSGCLVFCAGEAPGYTLEQLMRGSAEMLGRGSVGTTYKAVLDNRLIVTVKRVDAVRMAAAGKEGFERHMEEVGRLRHPNIVPLRAYFHAKEERLLVYDYQPNGSLFSLIHGLRHLNAFHAASLYIVQVQ